jgi:transposase
LKFAGLSARFWLDEEAWAVIESLLPKNRPGARRVDDRRVISGILHMLRSRCPRRDCPPAYGPPERSIRHRSCRLHSGDRRADIAGEWFRSMASRGSVVVGNHD